MSLVVDALKKIKRENDSTARIQAPPSMKENYFETDEKGLSSFAVKGALAAGGILCAVLAAAGVYFFMQKNDPARTVPYASAQKDRGAAMVSGVAAPSSSAPGNSSARAGASAVALNGAASSSAGMPLSGAMAANGDVSGGVAGAGGSVPSSTSGGSSVPGAPGGSGTPGAVPYAKNDDGRDGRVPSSSSSFVGAAYMPGFGAPASPSSGTGGASGEAMKANLDSWSLELPGFSQPQKKSASPVAPAKAGVPASSPFAGPVDSPATNKAADISAGSASDKNKTGFAVFPGERAGGKAAASETGASAGGGNPEGTPLKKAGRTSENSSKAASGLGLLHGLSSSNDPLTVMGGKTIYPGDAFPEKRTGKPSDLLKDGSGESVSGSAPATSGAYSSGNNAAGSAPRDIYGFPSAETGRSSAGGAAAMGSKPDGAGAADPFSMRNSSDPFGLSPDGPGGPSRGMGPAMRPDGSSSKISGGSGAMKTAGDSAFFPEPDNGAGMVSPGNVTPGSAAALSSGADSVSSAGSSGGAMAAPVAGSGVSSGRAAMAPTAGSAGSSQSAATDARRQNDSVSAAVPESLVFPPLIDGKNPAASSKTTPKTSAQVTARSSAALKPRSEAVSAKARPPEPFGSPSAVRTPLSNAEYASLIAAGRSARDAEDYGAALENYQKAWRSRHEETVASDVAYLWLDAGSAENALAALTQAKVKNPRVVAAVAVGMTEKSFLPEAGAVLKYAEGLRDTGAISYARGYRAEAEGDFKSAEEFYRSACRLDSGDPLYFYSLARALDLQGKYDEALVEYRQVLALKPNNELSGYAVSRIRDLGHYLSK